MSNNCLVSVIVPCYNQSIYLNDALGSLSKQTYTNWECVIVNDGSTDSTEEVAINWVNRDSRFKYFMKLNGGLSSARNFAIAQASGHYILPLDDDDYLHPRYIEQVLPLIANNAEVKVAYSDVQKTGVESQVWELPLFSLRKLALNNIITATAIYRRSDFDRYGPYNEDLRTGWEDWDFWLSMLKDGGSVCKISQPLFYYRIKEHSMLKDQISDLEKMRASRKYIFLKHIDFYIEHFGDPVYVYRKKEELVERINKLKSNKLLGLLLHLAKMAGITF